jgi:hypothetical protein
MQYISTLKIIIDCMKVWKKQCEEVNGNLPWNGVSQFIRQGLLDKDPNPMQKEIDLAFGAKYRKVCVILLLDFFSFVFPIMMTLPCLTNICDVGEASQSYVVQWS